jgi:O-antigen/teichoic acid export membrane protein
MSKATSMAKVSAMGSFHLLWGLVASSMILSVGTIFIARLLGSDLYGLYSVVLTVPTLMGTFRDWGINTAMTKFSAQYKSQNNTDEIRSILVSGIVFELVLGLVLTTICFSMSDFLATVIYNRPGITSLIQIASISILANGMISAASAAFTGFEKMKPNSIVLVCQSIFKTALIIALVYFGFGTSGAVIGHTASIGFAGLIGIFFVWMIYRSLPKPLHGLQIRSRIKAMLRYGTPLSFSSMLSGFSTQFYYFLLPIYYVIDNTAIGNLGIATTFVVLIGFFANPITTMLFPAFSKLDPLKDRNTLQNVHQFSVKYASLFVVPVATLVICLSETAVSTLFGTSYGDAPLFLALLAINYIFTAVGSLSNGNLISSQGQTRVILYLSSLTAAIGFPMGYMLIMNFGVLGLIITSLTSGLPSLFISVGWIKRHYGVTVDWASSGKICLSSAITAVLTYVIILQLHNASWIRLVVGVVVFMVILFPTLLLTRSVNRVDICNAREMISAFGPLGRVLNVVLSFVQKVMLALRL